MVRALKRLYASQSLDRLDRLVQSRHRYGANRDEIDQAIWDAFGENWAILFTDLAGFSEITRTHGIIHFLDVIHLSHSLMAPQIEHDGGILLKTEGDSLMVLYHSASTAIESAVALQNICKAYSKNKPIQDQVRLCVGIGYGKILKFGDQDVFGEEVNNACKLGEDMAKDGEIFVSESAVAASTLPNGCVLERVKDRRVMYLPAYRILYESPVTTD